VTKISLILKKSRTFRSI